MAVLCKIGFNFGCSLIFYNLCGFFRIPSPSPLVIGVSNVLVESIAASADVSCADMRRDIQEIFRATPHSKQVMMFSATLSRDIRPVCKKFMQDVIIPLG